MASKLVSTSRSLPIALMHAREAVMGPIREMLGASGVTEQQWRVLRVLEEAGALDASTLAQRAALLQPSLTRIIKGMVAKGLVTQVQGEHDRRRQEVAITDTGVALIAANATRAAEIAEGWRAHLGEDRYEALLDLLGDLAGRDGVQ
ncbi:homoprotocatechuate degradation operon regulator HpaR [Sulfitobacter pseudonitzschiae]|uniref:Homoprotocatechuate degradation operon regulator HpaR n=1 Tax=Pseudosulfitobacter pseudonitzschiae TaxID=1402135 RepID=A0A9Q2P350_9RHOB|nr:homoprotocatechuate degradation operon regulator HpaR [Pseudosulfitobacter pseudonitzschiae]MBM2293107.1 homoprotocatechuate degradation operon regulator HpaR [Pseudosulfitobacter pseudonitzschiae]MBM2297794.1 homoprotocatechuate degradation operon regulator HpaR [Pseudosulfitobacter pseudonitzschiae]MBM2302708.1 homoprotocatechuate degradation operon regulator HpaR [Pseudosulfitobacter pseudonitzschiae]MBM2312626.1 homoprotocatechuate degradation operon regulator HpaR [Pseudosulfitobacter p